MKKPKVGRPAKPPGKFLFQILDFVGRVTCFRVVTRYSLAVTQRQPQNAKDEKMKTQDCYSLINIQKTRELLAAKNISTSHITTKRTLVVQRQMLKDLASANNLRPIYE